MTERLTLEDNRVALALYGERNANLKLIERETGAQLHARGNELTIVGPEDGVAIARSLVEQLYGMARKGAPISPEDIGRAAVALRADKGIDLQNVFQDTILVAGRARPATRIVSWKTSRRSTPASARSATAARPMSSGLIGAPPRAMP